MAKKVSQTEMRQMMQKMKAEKAPSTSTDSRLKKYKLNSKEIALIEMEKKRKADEEIDKKKKFAKRAGVPETFFDSAKTKAFLNLQKAPQKSILKNSGSPSPSARNVPAASAKATGREWTSSEPILNKGAEKKEKSLSWTKHRGREWEEGGVKNLCRKRDMIGMSRWVRGPLGVCNLPMQPIQASADHIDSPVITSADLHSSLALICLADRQELVQQWNIW